MPVAVEDQDAGAVEVPLFPSMALALWGDPVIVAKQPTRVPYDVLWIVVDALRPDVAASLHDPDEDAAELAAPRPPLEARLPAVPGLMPGIDRLAARGVRFVHAWSAGAWTRPGTLAMLCGERSSELGIDTREWVLPAAQVSHYYGSEPPLVSLVLRRSGVETAAFVNNFFMAGYASVGLDMGFERVTDHRYRNARHGGDHEGRARLARGARGQPVLPLRELQLAARAVRPAQGDAGAHPAAPAGPRDREGARIHGRGREGRRARSRRCSTSSTPSASRESTLVVVTSDHGETLSSAHAGFAMDHLPVRFHHAVGNFEETTRVPIVMALPGLARRRTRGDRAGSQRGHRADGPRRRGPRGRTRA